MKSEKSAKSPKITVPVAIPPGLWERFQQEAEERGITVSELARELVCSNFGRPPQRLNPEATVPLSAESRFNSDHYLVVKRTAEEITLTTAVQVPFEEVMAKFAALNLSEEEILEIAGS